MNSKCNKIALAILVGAMLTLNVACRKGSRDERRLTLGQSFPKSKIEKVCALAKGYALGTKTAFDVKTAYKQLSSSDLVELSGNKACSPDFAVLMSIGLASPESYTILDEYIASLLSNDSPKNKLIARALIKELRSPKRSSDENITDRQKILNLVLSSFPDRINDLKDANRKFDNVAFNSLVSSLSDSKVAPIAAALSKENMNTWFDWATDTDNKVNGQAAFKEFYLKSPSDSQELLRSKLLEKNYSEKDQQQRLKAMKFLLNEADAWGIKAGLDTDQYKLSSTPGNFFRGSLLYVLMMSSIRENIKDSNVSLQSFDDFNKYAQWIKQEINDDDKYLTLVTKTSWGNAPDCRTALLKALTPFNYDNFVDYFLNLDTPKDVFEAVQRPVAEVSNQTLRKLYERVIGSDSNRATELSKMKDETVSKKRFIDFLVARTIDDAGDSNKILRSFLSTIEKNELPLQLNGGNPQNTPILALVNENRKNDDNIEKEKMLKTLSIGDDGSVINTLSEANLRNLVTLSYNNSNPSNQGQDEFKAIYTKQKLSVANKKIMRSDLLQKAYDKGSESLQTMVDEITDHADKWGLRADVLSDLPFELKNHQPDKPSHSGPLLYVLVKRSIQETNREKDLRGYAQAIKNALGGNYVEHITKKQFNNEIIKTVLWKYLAGKNRQDFTNSYLANEDIQDVYDAAERAENLVSNAMLDELYKIVIGDQKTATQILAKKPQDSTKNRFIHNLLKRSADSGGYSKSLLIKFLNNLQLKEAQERKILSEVKNGHTPLMLFMKANRPLAKNTRDDSIQKEAMLKRLMLHAKSRMLAKLAPEDLGSQVKDLSLDCAFFKQIYALINAKHDPLSKNQAKAMRSALLEEELKKGSKSFSSFLTGLIDTDNKWGLKDGLDTDIYKLDTHEGSLLYVLAKRAIDQAKNDASPYDTLKTYSTIIKAHLDSKYDAHLRVKQNGQTIKGELEKALNADQCFANSYLAVGKIDDVYDGAGKKEEDLSNAKLRRLYTTIIGDDEAKASNLALKVSKIKARFIHRLLRRSADEDTLFILDKFLGAIYKHAETTTVGDQKQKTLAAIEAERAQLNSRSEKGYPLGIFLSRLNNSDSKIAKAEMVNRLLRNDDNKTVWKTISEKNLQDQSWFYSAGTKGNEIFNRLYQQQKMSSAKRLAMRSALIADAAQEGMESLKNLIKNITEPTDPWALKEGLIKDKYELHFKNENRKHNGTLISVLSKLVALELKTFKDENPNKIFAPLKALREITTELRKSFENEPGHYVAYVDCQNAVSELESALKVLLGDNPNADLKHLFAGYPEYFLSLDDTAAGFDEDLIFRVIQAPQRVGFDSHEFKWLYDQVIKTPTNAATLAEKEEIIDQNKSSFIHFLVMRHIGNGAVKLPGLYEVLDDYLQKIGEKGDEILVQREIEKPGTKDKKNALQLLADPNRLKQTGETVRAKMMALLAYKANEKTLRTLSKDELDNVLNSVRNHQPEYLPTIASNFPKDRLNDFSDWCQSSFIKDKKSHNNLDILEVQEAYEIIEQGNT